MAYFANGSEGECFNSQCALCRYGTETCPIMMVQLNFNYDACNNEVARSILNDLVKDNGTCEMYKMFEKNVGSIHKPFNTNKDYDWGNKTYAKCKASMFPNYMFYTFPQSSEELNCNQWGCTGEGYLKWWFEHLPKYTWGVNLNTGSIGAK